MTTAVEPMQGVGAAVVEPAVKEPSDISLPRNIKLGMFHIGSAVAEVLTQGVWNRVAIAEMGLQATPVALLLSLKYLLTPLAIWAGQRSDSADFFGYRRLPFVWGGRLLMAFSAILLGAVTVGMAQTAESLAGWLGLLIAFLIFSVGSALSGTTFLSLIYDITPRAQRTRTVSVVWFFLILGFALGGILFGVLFREQADPLHFLGQHIGGSVMGGLVPNALLQGFMVACIVAALIMAAIWFVALVGEEKPVRGKRAAQATDSARVPFRQALKIAWSNPQTRLFFSFLGMSTVFFYTQDVILEPFGGQVFGISVAHTSRFSAYWGTLTLIFIIASLFLARRFPQRVNNMALSRWSMYVLIGTFGLLAVCALLQIRPLVTIGLVVMGVGLGLWTVGTLGLMMDMTRAWGIGLYLSLWTISETLARGVGTVLGGVVKDLGFALSGQYHLAYGLVFVVQTVGFVASLLVLNRISVEAFQRSAAPSAETVVAQQI